MNNIRYQVDCWKAFLETWDRLPPILAEKIQKTFVHTELRERYLSGFPTLRSDEKLDLSLDDIIDPGEVWERRCENGGCHPGRLALDGSAYIQRDWPRQKYPRHLRCGPVYMQEPSRRTLTDSDRYGRPVDGHQTGFGFQASHESIYFAGGVPLIPWSTKEGNMGLKLFAGKKCPWACHHNDHTCSFQFLDFDYIIENFKRLPHLDDEHTYFKKLNPESDHNRKFDGSRSLPRSFVFDKDWKKGKPDVYGKYLMECEDIDSQ